MDMSQGCLQCLGTKTKSSTNTCVCAVEGEYDDTTSTCKTCNYKCRACITNATNCTSCSDTNRSTSNSTNCSCDDGWFEVVAN